MLDILDLAHPGLTLALIVTVLVLLWMTSVLSQRLRVLENRIDSVEQEQRQIDEELAVLAPSAGAPQPVPGHDLDRLGEREPAAAPPQPARL